MARTTDMTQGSIAKKLILFVLPMMVGTLLQQFYHMADTLIVGRTLGVERLAGVGATGTCGFFVMGFVMGLMGGCSVRVSQSFGSHDEKALRRAVASSVLIAGFFALLFAAIFAPLTGPLLKLLNTTDDIYPYSLRYLRIIYLGIPATMLYNLLSSLQRSVGDSKTPLIFLIVSSALNIVLDLVLIVVFKMDVEGAAIATIASQLISALLCLLSIFKRHRELIPLREDWKNLAEELRAMLKIGLPMGFQMTIISTGTLVLQGVLNTFGASAVAANTVGSQIFNLIHNPLNSFGTAVATFVGQNYGAKKYDRIKKGVRTAIILSVAFAVVTAAIVWFIREPLTMLYLDEADAEVMELVTVYLSWILPSLWMVSFVFVYRAAAQGLGDGISTLVGGVAELVMRSVLPLVLAPVMGFAGVCTATPGAWFACGVLMLVVYLRRYRIKCALPENAAENA